MAVFDRLLLFQAEEAVSAALNMAIDEALLETTITPAIRFYRWERPSISFGYFGKFQEIAEFESTHDLVRRWTGGGIVFHENDLTYSLIIPTPDSAQVRDSKVVYREVHEVLRDVLNDFGLNATIMAEPPPASSTACFVSPVIADVMIGQAKVAGAAHRRTKLGLLHQGSVQNVDLPRELPKVFAGRLSTHCETKALPDAIKERAAVIAAQRYGTSDWLKRR
jgi:lipoyl(octanoyl) transferase